MDTLSEDTMPELFQKDACDLLDADHLAVKHLFVEYARLAYAPGAGAGGQRAALALKACDEITLHARLEEEIFYPALRQAAPGAADVLDEAEDQHAEAKALIARIREVGEAGDEMDQLVADLARAIEDHVKEERDELFPKASSAAGLDLAELGARLEQRRQELAGEETPG